MNSYKVNRNFVIIK